MNHITSAPNLSAGAFPASSESSLRAISAVEIPPTALLPGAPPFGKSEAFSLWFTVLHLLETLPRRNKNSTLPCEWTPYSQWASKPLDLKCNMMSERHNGSDSGWREWLHHPVILQQQYKKMPWTSVLLSFKKVFNFRYLTQKGPFEAPAWLRVGGFGHPYFMSKMSCPNSAGHFPKRHSYLCTGQLSFYLSRHLTEAPYISSTVTSGSLSMRRK